MLQQTQDSLQLNELLDALLVSEDARLSALTSDNPLLRTAARLSSNVHPELTSGAREAILTRVIGRMIRVVQGITDANARHG